MSSAAAPRPLVVAAALAAPLAGLAVLLAAPATDVRWEDHPAHFWLVLAAAALSAALAVATGDVAARRGDARLVLVSLAFLAAAGFLGLHALATPGVLLDGRNAGFVVATPIGLLVASALLAASAAPALQGHRSAAVVRRARAARLGLVAVIAAWGVASLAGAGPLDDPTPPESGSPGLVVVAVAGIALYALAAVGYAGLYRRRPAPLPLAVASACILLAEAMIAVALSRNWHASWWEWHVLMLAAVAVVAIVARRQAPDERWGDLYLDETAAGRREVSVVFADLEGSTTWAEGRDPSEVQAMLNAAFDAAVPVVARCGGEIDRLVGDALVAVFNRRGDRPDHATCAARAALGIVEAMRPLAAEHPDRPRFRVGVNTGTAAVGVLGARGGRTHTAVGDAVNVAARLETAAPVDAVVIGAATLAALRGARVTPMGALPVKGRREPVEAYVLEGLA
jgi:class 3 adenylate cyclase